MADNYTVVNQRPTTRLVNGSFQAVREVTFTSSGGYTGSVYVPVAGLTADKVKSAIEAEIASVDEVNKL